MSKQKKKQYFLVAVAAGMMAAVLAVTIPLMGQTGAARRNISPSTVVNFEDDAKNKDVIYLSDYDFMAGSNTRYGTITKDQTADGKPLTLRYENSDVVFEKGIWAHATSNVYYDLDTVRNGKTGYDYLSAYVGLNTTSKAGNGVIFWIYGSNDPELADSRNPANPNYWTVIYNEDSQVKKPREDAEMIKVDVSGYKYIRLQVSDNGGNASDHSVWADIKLVKNSYEPYIVPTVEEMDTQLQAVAGLDVLNNADHEMMLLRRDLLKNAGQYTMSAFIQSSEENRRMMNWLYNDVDALRMYTTGGKPTGTYAQSFEVLSQLYNRFYESDVANGGADSELHLKMMMALALTHSKQVRFWIRDTGAIAGSADSPNISRAVDRYSVIKRMYEADKLNNLIFSQLEVEEMRYVMFTELGDDEMEWTNDWMRSVGRGPYSYPPVPYISIGNQYWWDVNYNSSYVDPKSGKTWAELYKLVGSNYTNGQDKTISGNYFIGFEPNAPHLWMINYYGGVCWQISNFGQNMVASYGIPSTTFGQPGHLAYANYELGTGVPAWALTNDVYGWSKSNFTGYTNINTYHPVRQMNNWGAATGEYSALVNRYGYQGSYVTMAQAAINDFENYERSQILVKKAEAYGNNLTQQEQIYNAAIAEQDFNFDAWYGLLVNYLNQGNKTAQDWYNLAVKLTDSRMKNFAVAYYDLMQTIIVQIPTDGDREVAGYGLSVETILRKTLTWMAENNNNTNIEGIFRQGNVTRTLANAILGTLNNEVAVFSFDGEDAGVLKLGAKYETSNAAFDYSLDGGATWSSGVNKDNFVTERRIKLSEAEIAQINENDDIKVHIQGVPWTEANYYTIDIKKGVLPSNLYANDKENRVVGVNERMEWCVVTEGDACENNSANWTSYLESSPLRIGNISVRVRVRATGVYLTSDPSVAYNFTTDTDPETRKYIPVSHLSVAAVSSQATGGGQYGNAIYAIDGNFNTRWHSAWNGSDHDQWIVIKFDHLVELAALGFVPAGGGNGRILQGDVYVTTEEEPDLSNFGAIRENFEHVGIISSDCSNAGEVLCDGVWPNVDNALPNDWHARTFEFRRTEERDVVDDEGNTVKETVVTSRAVTARYVAIKANQTSNHGNFIAARMLNFYEDKTQNPAPTAGVAYSTIEPTKNDVIARLVNTTEEEIEVVDEDGNVLGADGAEHVFTDNGEYTFRFRRVGDENGKIGTAIAKVNWIMKEAVKPEEIGVQFVCVNDSADGNTQTVDCSREQGKTNRSVSVKLTFPEVRQVRILNNGKQDEFGDDYESEAPDPGTTNPGTPDGGDGNGDSVSPDQDSLDPFTYLFMRNGTFTFEFEDVAGNRGTFPVTVDWIDKAAPKVEIKYSTTDETDGEVVATVVSVPKYDEVEGGELMAMSDFELSDEGQYDEDGLEYGEEFIMLNNNGSSEYRFAKNGEFTFEYQDAAGNKGEIVAKVDWIREKQDDNRPGGDDNTSGDENNGDVNRPNGGDGANNDQGSGDHQPGQGVVGGGNVSGNVVADNNGSGDNGSSGSVSGAGNVKIEAEGLPEGAKTESKKLTLTSALRAKFGANSELYEINFVGENGEKIDKGAERVVVTVPGGKKLKAIYIVKDDNTTEKVEFEVIDDTHIAIKNPIAGKYLFDYEDQGQSDAPVVEPGDDAGESIPLKRWYEGPLPWIGGGAAVVLLIGGVAMYSARRRH